MGMFMSQIYWRLEFLFSGGGRGAESHKKKKDGIFWNNIGKAHFNVFTKRMLLFMSLIVLIVYFYYVEEHWC